MLWVCVTYMCVCVCVCGCVCVLYGQTILKGHQQSNAFQCFAQTLRLPNQLSVYLLVSFTTFTPLNLNWLSCNTVINNPIGSVHYSIGYTLFSSGNAGILFSWPANSFIWLWTIILAITEAEDLTGPKLLLGWFNLVKNTLQVCRCNADCYQPV